MVRVNPFGLALLLSPLLLCGPTRATTVERMSFVELARDAELIVQGIVSARRLEVRDGLPWTCVRIEIEKLLKGSVGNSIELCFLGGKIGDTTTAVTGTQVPEVGRRGIFFSYDPRANFANPIVGWLQGLYYVVRQEGREFITTASGIRIGQISLVDGSSAPMGDAAAGVIAAQPGSVTGMTPDEFIRSIHEALVKPQ